MKKNLLFLIVTLLLSLLLFSACSPKNDTISLIVDGKSDYVIIRGENASATEINASNELQSFLRQISGCEIPVKTDAEAPVDKEIVVGKTNREDSDEGSSGHSDLGDDGYCLHVTGDKFFISGGERAGTLYGVYSYLEDYLGVKWYAPGCQVIPETKSISVPSDLKKSYTPKITIRDSYWYSTGYDIGWSAFNKQNVDTFGKSLVDESDPGSSFASFGGIMCPELAHSFNRLCSYWVYGAEHPEYFALNEDGKRQGGADGNLCLTNPDVLAIVTENVLKYIEENPGHTVVTVSQDDNGVWCHCDNCMKVIEEEGSVSGPNIRFVNAVARAVAEKYPDVTISTLAYIYSTHPCKTAPEENVMVVLCSSHACFSHPFEECQYNAWTRDGSTYSFVEDLVGWGKLTDNIYVWDYDICFRHYLAPFANFDTLQPNVQFMAENGVSGLRAQGDHHNDKSPEFGELKSYLLAKLMWDPYIDYDAEMKGFLKAYYGDGWENIYKYIQLTTEATEDVHLCCINMDIPDMMHMTMEQARYADNLWDAAEEAVADDAVRLERVQRSRISFEFWKLGTMKYIQTEYFEKKIELFNDLIKHGIWYPHESSEKIGPVDGVDYPEGMIPVSADVDRW